MTPVRRRILTNISEGRHPYDGFHGSQLGGAIRSVHFLGYELPHLIDIKDGRLVLTPTGLNALSETVDR